MKFRISLILIVAALVVIGMSGAALAFHAGGVAQCEGCHTMHNSKGGNVMSRATDTVIGRTNNLVVGQAGDYLLQGTDQSSTCLNCHGVNETTGKSYHIMSLAQAIPVERTPGGDFAWLKKSSIKGHSIVAVDYGLTAETTKAGNQAPGNDAGAGYPVADLQCSSCHDPHGKYRRLSTTGAFATTGEPIAGSGSYGADPTNGEAVGAYRILGGKNYLPKSMESFPGLAFSADPMIAAAPSTYNSSETTTETIVNYGDSTVGGWCAQCHPKMHEANAGIQVHPNDETLGTVANTYNNYVKSGDTSGGTGGGFTSLIPVAVDNVKVNSALANHFTTGMNVAQNDRVMCLSCHRAHASAFDYMMRFPIAEEMVIDDGSGNPIYNSGGRDLAGLSAAEVQAGLYDRPASNWDIGQRTLCNKCHAKD